MRYSENDFIVGCEESECSIVIHKVLLIPGRLMGGCVQYDEQIALHKNVQGIYFYRLWDGTRKELER